MNILVKLASEKPGPKKPAGGQKKPEGAKATVRPKGTGNRRQPPERKRPAVHPEQPAAEE